MTIASDLAAVVALAQVDASKLHGVVHGPSTGPTSLVSTDAGDVKTLARITAEALAAAGAGVVPFAPPVAWATGLTAVVGPPATAVTYLGESYYCNTGHLTGATFAADSAKWTKFAAAGADGDDAGGILTTNGDLLTRIAGVAARLGIGSAGQVLGIASGLPAWITPSIKLTVWTANATWTVDTNMRQALLFALGSGSGGGATNGTAATIGSSAIPGAAGGWSIKLVDKATAGSSQSVTVGAAANGGAAGNNAGAAGNDTSIGALCVAKGPAAGGASSSAVNAVTGCAGGVVGTGDLAFPGNDSIGAPVYTNGVPQGSGASSPFGSGGRMASVSASGGGAAGGNATGYGAGGAPAGSYNNGSAFAGGNSSPGIAFALELVRP